jgi:hypothetical protein
MPQAKRATRPKFCKLLRETVHGEPKRRLDYIKLRTLAPKTLPKMSASGAPIAERFHDLIEECLDDEAKNTQNLSRYLKVYC